MKASEAKRVIEALANGINPETGEVLPKENIFNEPIVIRGLFFALTALEPIVIKEKKNKIYHAILEMHGLKKMIKIF